MPFYMCIQVKMPIIPESSLVPLSSQDWNPRSGFFCLMEGCQGHSCRLGGWTTFSYRVVSIVWIYPFFHLGEMSVASSFGLSRISWYSWIFNQSGSVLNRVYGLWLQIIVTYFILFCVFSLTSAFVASPASCWLDQTLILKFLFLNHM